MGIFYCSDGFTNVGGMISVDVCLCVLDCLVGLFSFHFNSDVLLDYPYSVASFYVAKLL
jgi:hypothetical protein